jgi:YD repeat-containing protein
VKYSEVGLWPVIRSAWLIVFIVCASVSSRASAQTTADRIVVKPTRCPWGLSGTVEGGCFSGLVNYPGTPDEPYSWRFTLRDDRFSRTTDTVTGRTVEKICRGNPIDITSGAKIEEVIDFPASGGEMPLSLGRTYNNQNVSYERSIFGSRWRSNLDDFRLHFEAPSTEFKDCDAYPGISACTAQDTANRPHFELVSDDRKVAFYRGVDDVYREKKASPVAYGTRNADGTWTINTEDNQVLKFTPGGFLLEKQTRSGISWKYTYGGLNGTQLQRVTHASGRYIELTWTENALTTVRDPDGNLYRYSYIKTPGILWDFYYLKTVTLPGLPATAVEYHYENEAAPLQGVEVGPLVGKSYNGARFSTYTFASGKAKSTEHAGVEKYSFIYLDVTGGTKVAETNPLGKKTNYLFDSKGKLLSVDGEASANCQASSKGVDYDGNGYRLGETDFNDNLTTYQYHSSGRLLSKVEAAGTAVARTTAYTWDSENRITTETLVGHREIAYAYDGAGRLSKTSIKNISPNVAESSGQVREIIYTYTNHPNGLLSRMSVEGPSPGSKTVYTYSTLGDVLSIENGVGHATTFGGYDGLGQPGYIVSPNGARTDFVYDERGRLVSEKKTVNGDVHTMSYVYDGFGRLASITHPDGVKQGYQYDVAGRLISEYLSEGGGLYAQKLYTYNAMSLPVSEEIRRVSFEPVQGTVR